MRPTPKSSRLLLAGAVWCSLALGSAAQDETNRGAPPSPEEVEAKINELLDAFDLTPQPVPEVPDNPPPHEGAMIDLPDYRIEPPDMILVEVLEALPGRPISGERLVRADGTISLGFYGDVHVRGLTLKQAKVQIIKSLRGTLSNEALGLLQEWSPPPVEPEKSENEDEDGDENEKAEGSPFRGDDDASNHDEIDWPAWTPAPPERSNRIFVDVTRYNSKNYHVLGDVASPGRVPITGNETVLDALLFAGGLLPTADPHNIRLVRPGRDGKPGKIHLVNLEAIRDRGETATNYQIFPGDRIVVGRDKVVERTVQVDRLATAIHTVIASIQREAEMIQALRQAYPGRDVATLLRDDVEFWLREMKRPGGAALNEDVLRDALLRRFQAKPEESKDED